MPARSQIRGNRRLGSTLDNGAPQIPDGGPPKPGPGDWISHAGANGRVPKPVIGRARTYEGPGIGWAMPFVLPGVMQRMADDLAGYAADATAGRGRSARPSQE
ncbi:hypothetical protein GCM10009608_40140 [Pseudonocardia alaniniphila]